MKNLSIIFAFLIFFASCGPSKQEQQAMLDQTKNEILDSILKLKQRADSLADAVKRLKDSTAQAEETHRAIEDSLNTNINSQRWIYKQKSDPNKSLVATLNSVDDSLTIQVLDYISNANHYGEIFFYCEKIKLYEGFFRGKNSIQIKVDNSPAREYVVVESGVDCVKIRNLYTYVSDIKYLLQHSTNFEICFPTTDGWKTYQFIPEDVLNLNNAQ